MTWDLSKLYTGFDAPEYARDIEAYRRLADRAYEDAKALVAATESLDKMICDLERIEDLAMKTHHFAVLTLSADANNADAMAAITALEPIENRMCEVMSALSAKLGAVEDLDDLIEGSQKLRAHAYLLRCLKRDAAHVLDPAIEPAVLEMQRTGGSAWAQLRDRLDGNHMVDIMKDGKMQALPLSEVRGMAYSPDREVRKAAYEAELASYPKMEIAMAACLNGIKGEANTLAGLRHFDSVLDMALDTSKTDRATLDALLRAMRESLPMFRRYFRVKAKLLGYEGGLKFYDLFAPVGEAKCDYTPEDARAILTRELGAFSPRMGRMIDRAFDERLIDMYPRNGKTGGAFCEGVHPLNISYVLTNFDGSYSSVSTLAHELGHAYQNECMGDVPVLLSDMPMPLAETASTFNETLLAECILKTASRGERIALLDQQLSDAAQVIVDILSRFLFEQAVVERRKDAVMGADELCAIMMDAQKQTYGDGLDPECLHPYMWACKCHYYMTDVHFYNFPYAFGQLFAVGLYRMYLSRGPEFLQDYEKLLRDAGSGDVSEVAASIGINTTEVGFWREGLHFFEEKLTMLEAEIDQ